MNNEWTMKKFMKGAVLLTIAALIVKALSAVYRIPFQNIVGDQGFYIYQQVYPFIGVLTVWTSYGFAVAISKLLADHMIRRLVQSTIDYFTNRIYLFKRNFHYQFYFTIFGSRHIGRWMGDGELAQLLRTGSFVVLLMPVLALLKGSFQAEGRMEPVAYGQVVEQMVRVTVILVGTYYCGENRCVIVYCR